MEAKALLALAVFVVLGIAEGVRLAKWRSKFPEPEFLPVMELNSVKALEKALDQLTVQVSDLRKDLVQLKAQQMESETAPE